MDPAGERSFRATVGESERGGRWVEVPFDVREAFGEARPPVSGTVDGATLRSRIAVYGGRSYLGLSRELRAAAGIEVGDEVEVVLRRDDAPRVVELPPDLATALDTAPDARDRFDALAFTHRREYAQWVAGGKRPETRQRRAEQALAMLRQGVPHP